MEAAPWKGPDVSLKFFSDLTQSSRLFPLKFQTIIKNQDNSSYLALLERSPFWEPGVSDIEERGSLHFVLGYVGGEP